MKLDFTTYTDEKLILWIKAFEATPMIEILYDKDGFRLHREALNELTSRNLTLNWVKNVNSPSKG